MLQTKLLAETEMEIWKEIESDLKDYKRMVDDIDRMTAELAAVGGTFSAHYGIEATLPKSGGKRDPVAREVVRRDRKHRQLRRMQDKIDRIDHAAETITDVRQMILLDLLMEGKSMKEICAHMRLSRSYVYEIKAELIYSLAQEVE